MAKLRQREYCVERLKDNQGRGLEGVKRHFDWLDKAAKAGRIRSAEAAKKHKSAEWVVYKGVQCLRVDKEPYIGIPNPEGRKNAKRFDIINIKTREYITQVKGTEVREWLFLKWKSMRD